MSEDNNDVSHKPKIIVSADILENIPAEEIPML